MIRTLLRGLLTLALTFGAIASATLAVSAFTATPAYAVTVERKASAYPLASNVLFAARTGKVLALRCYNPTTNSAATVIYPSGFTVVIQAGGSLWEVVSTSSPGFLEAGAYTSTGTPGNILDCIQTYE